MLRATNRKSLCFRAASEWPTFRVDILALIGLTNQQHNLAYNLLAAVDAEEL
jgi:hypothetical protein